MGKKGKRWSRRQLPSPNTTLQRPVPNPSGQTPPHDDSIINLIRHVFDRSLDLAEKLFKHHIAISIIAVVLFGTVFVVALFVRRPGDCVSITGEYAGTVSLCAKQPKPNAPVPQDGLHGDVYADLDGGYAVSLSDPDGWTIIPATDHVDPANGSVAKQFTFPPGLITKVPLTIETDYGVTAFISRMKINSASVDLWIYRMPTEGRTVEQFIELETGPLRMRETGLASAVYTAGLAAAGVPLAPSRQGTGSATVSLSTQVISPDHRDALLLWIAPYQGLNADIIGRFAVGPRYTYYLVAVRPHPTNDAEHRFNDGVRTMIESFRILDTAKP